MISLFKLFLAPSNKQIEFLSMIFNPDVNYWRNWLDKNKIEEIEPWVFFFLPIMHKTFQELKLEHPSLNIIRGVYKKSIYRNQLFIRELLKLNSALKEKGIEPIFLTELSIYFRDPSQPRYLRSVDVLLPRTKEVYHVIKDLKWYRSGESNFTHTSGSKIVIKWENVRIKRLNEQAMEYEIDGKNSIKVIPPEEIFVLLCISSGYTLSAASISWAYDLKRLLSTTESFDWQKAFLLANRVGKVAQVCRCLEYLREEFPEIVSNTNNLRFLSVQRNWSGKIVSVPSRAVSGVIGVLFLAKVLAGSILFGKLLSNNSCLAIRKFFPKIL